MAKMHCMHVLYPHIHYMHGGIYKRVKEKGKRVWSMKEGSYVLIKKLLREYSLSNWCTLSLKSKVKGSIWSQSLSIYLKYFLTKACTNFESFGSKTPLVLPHDPHIVMDLRDIIKWWTRREEAVGRIKARIDQYIEMASSSNQEWWQSSSKWWDVRTTMLAWRRPSTALWRSRVNLMEGTLHSSLMHTKARWMKGTYLKHVKSRVSSELPPTTSKGGWSSFKKGRQRGPSSRKQY